MTPVRPKILFVLGTSRSGSTLFDNILGQIDGFLSIGELRQLWLRVNQGRLCGCGEPIARCPLWSHVLDRLSAELGADATDPSKVLSWQRNSVKLKHLRSVLKARPEGVLPDSALAHYLDVIETTYRTLAEIDGTRVIIDSSKSSAGAALLHLIPDIDYYFVHLVRDARGVTYSEMAKKVNPDWPQFAYMSQGGAGFMIVAWLTTNIGAEIVRRSHRRERTMLIRYEDFITDAEAVIGRVLAMLDESPSSLPFRGADYVELGVNHTVAGNPSRFETGSVELRPDTRWLTKLPAGRKWITTIACLPLLLRYGYPILPRRYFGMLRTTS